MLKNLNIWTLRFKESTTAIDTYGRGSDTFDEKKKRKEGGREESKIGRRINCPSIESSVFFLLL